MKNDSTKQKMDVYALEMEKQDFAKMLCLRVVHRARTLTPKQKDGLNDLSDSTGKIPIQ